MSSVIPRVLKENPCDSPFASQKCNPLAAGLAIGAGSLLGGMLGLAGNSNTNSANLEIARETNEQNKQLAKEANELNYKMFKEQNQFNLEQWHRANQYNSPVEEVERLKAAGINPAFNQNIQAGNASPLSSVNSPAAERAQMTAPQMVAPDFGFVGQSVNAVLDSELRGAQIDEIKSRTSHNNIQNEFEARSLENRLAEQANNTKKGTIENDVANENLRLFRETYDALKRQAIGTANQTEKQVEDLEQRIAAQKITNEILNLDLSVRDKMNQASLASLRAGIKQALSAAYLSDKQALESAAREAVEKAREKGLKISNREANRIEESIVEKATYEADEAYWKSYNEMQKSHGVFKRLFGSSQSDAQPYEHDRYSRREHTSDYIKSHKDEILW